MPSLPSPVIRNSKVRAADWVGPTNRHSSRPQTQNAIGPESDSNAMPTTIMALSEATMTGLAPIRSSRRPPTTAPSAATVEAITPKINTSAGEMPYTLTPSTAPNAKTPDRPSRNTALTNR